MQNTGLPGGGWNFSIVMRLKRSLQARFIRLLDQEQVPCVFCPRLSGQGEDEQGHGARKTRAGVVR